jgi:hypothetical protein
MGPAEELDRASAQDLGFGAPDPGASQSAANLGFGEPEPGRQSKEQHGTLFMGSDAERPDDPSLGIPDDDDDASFADLNVDVEVEQPSPPPPSFEPPAAKPIDPAQFESPAPPAAPSPPPAQFESPAPPAAPPPPAPAQADPAEALAAFSASLAETAAPAAAGVTGEGLVELAISIEPGTLCFVHGDGAADELAGYIGVPVALVQDGPDGTAEVRAALESNAEPGTVVVRTEDPSLHLGFLLRRLEEGWRVLVETRSRTAEGARRILLGVGATAAAEAWLDAQVTSWAMLEEGHWKLL